LGFQFLDILGCVNLDVEVTNWNDDVVPTCIVMVLVLAMVASLGNTYLTICSGNYYFFSLGNDRLAIEQRLCISGRRPTSRPRDLLSQQQDEVQRETQISCILLKPLSVCSCEKSMCDLFCWILLCFCSGWSYWFGINACNSK
jgi:hypothetical protein